MTTTIMAHFEDTSLRLEARAVTGTERLGESFRYELDLFSPDPVDVSDVLGKTCRLRLSNEHGERWIAGIITQFVRIATAHTTPERRYRAVVEPAWSLLRLRRQARVYRHITVPDLVRKVLIQAGFPASFFEHHLGGTYAEREYVVQWLEDDLRFIRRLCEEEGLYFRAVTTPDGEPRFLLEDNSPAATPFDNAIHMVDDAGLTYPGLVAWSPRVRTERRAGKVTLRDHNPAHPAATLEAGASAGTSIETATEIYSANGRFNSPSEGAARAKLHLESLRADARRLFFETNALSLVKRSRLSTQAAIHAFQL